MEPATRRTITLIEVSTNGRKPPMPRTSRRFAIVTLALAFASQAAWAEGSASEGEPDHAGHPTEIVGIVPTRLLPSVLVVSDGSAFGWLNYFSGDATIKFPEMRRSSSTRT
jgi:hypothetical protein